MATSSITHNFVISNPNSVKLFIAAIDEADSKSTTIIPRSIEERLAALSILGTM